MTQPVDWIQLIIDDLWPRYHADELLEDDVRKSINAHCPLKEGVAYMPVPRCETCKHAIDGIGIRGLNRPRLHCVYLNMPTLADFGCVKWEAK